jgi:predicted nucleic acid-binding protein
MLVIDTSVAIRICDSGGNFRALKDSELVAPPLLWSEFTASVHAAVWRGERSAERGRRLIELLGGSPVRKRDHVRLLAEAWRLADELGWAKTYDAEYCALAAILDCRLVTLDGRLRRGADRLGFVVTPDEL